MTISSDKLESSQELRKQLGSGEWLDLYRQMVLSRLLDDEEIRLKKRNLIYFQVSSAGHEAIGAALGHYLKASHDWLMPYYRDRAMCLSLGMTPYDMMLSAVGSADDPISGGRQMPCHWSDRDLHIISHSSPVGTQFNQAVGVAEAGIYIKEAGLKLEAQTDEVIVVSSGEGGTSEGEFWEAINVAANKGLPILFLIEDNEYAISVPVEVTTAGGSISKCFQSMPGLKVLECSGSLLPEAVATSKEAVDYVREHRKPVLMHAHVTRPYSHSLSDDHKNYRVTDELEKEKNEDCLKRTREWLIQSGVATEEQLDELYNECRKEVKAASEKALDAPKPDPKSVTENLYSQEFDISSSPSNDGTPRHGGDAVYMAQAINRVLSSEMSKDERILVFGQDVADASRIDALAQCIGKGGVFKLTAGLQKKHGSNRVYNTLLAEASILGRAIGMALRGLKPVPEIQFLDFLWPAYTQIRSELATMRFRTNGEWTAPVVLRVPSGGYLRGGSLYHSQSTESAFTSIPGLLVACPSTAADAAGLLRSALKLDDPVIFLEHKHLYLQGYAKSNDPADDYTVPFGKASVRRAGNDISIIAWGAMVQKAIEASDKLRQRTNLSTEIIDLRTLNPLDKERIYTSVQKTGRVLIVDEEYTTCGFGAELAALIADECFEWLDAPIKRVAAKHSWISYSPVLEEATLPSVGDIEKALTVLSKY